MFTYFKTPFLLLAGIAFMGPLQYSLAGNEGDQNRARQLRESQDILPLERILEQAKAQHPGRIIEAELDQEENRWVYEIEILDENGVVWDINYDATTGKLLKTDRPAKKND